MKRSLKYLALPLIATMLLAGCGTDSKDAGDDTAADGPLRIKFVMNGTLGDKSFFDSAYAGLEQIRDDMGYKLDVVELGSERSKWQPGFEDAASTDDYDIFVAGTIDVVDYISELAPQYDDKRFWIFDAPVDYAGETGACSNKCENVYSVTFKQNEGGYLAGFAAAKTLAAKSLPGAEDATKVGVIGATEIPVVNDFIAGYKEGFTAAGGTESDILIQYVGGSKPFGDPAKAKEIANAMYGQGAATVWPVAGSSSFGVFEAATAANRYTIGIDSDQSETLTDAAQQKTVVTSILKNVGNALVDAAKKDAAGHLPYGKAESVGLAEGAIGFIDNELFKSLVPEQARTELDAAAKEIADGKIKVPSAY